MSNRTNASLTEGWGAPGAVPGRLSGVGLRVALISGNLGQGGSEKQAVYLARALRDVGVTIKIYHMRPGEFHEPILRGLGFDLLCLGAKTTNPFLRLAVLAADLRKFRPHVVQSGHFWANFYAGIAGRFCRAVSIGALRATLQRDLEEFAPWGPWLMRLPAFLLANSHSAKHAADAYGLSPARTFVLPNAIDLTESHARPSAVTGDVGAGGRLVVAAVGRLVPAKRFDRFLAALAVARRREPALAGVLIGEGPERPALEKLARDLGLLEEGLQFTGRRDDVPALLARADMLVLSSDHEGFPNAVLEAMAASLPVVTTPAGDAATVVQDGLTGFVVPFEEENAMAERIVMLAQSADLRRRMGAAGRRRVEERYSLDGLAARTLLLYHHMAERLRHRDLLHILSESSGVRGQGSPAAPFLP